MWYCLAIIRAILNEFSALKICDAYHGKISCEEQIQGNRNAQMDISNGVTEGKDSVSVRLRNMLLPY